uniref:epithelial membrane protein 2-like n=1 Tax=Ciona intestinalis TaxID=7719 RepID=UPI00089DC5B0|nr:epithelial membrane protein 2-like [Ciona intestinalis]|eukprot:XP_018667411.1 epithelial membrane protein 2-like [Ciona intestinalis]
MSQSYNTIEEDEPIKPTNEQQKCSCPCLVAALAAVTVITINSVSLATPAWIQSYSVNAGLWHICYSGGCHDYTSVQAYIKVVRGFLISSIVFVTITTIWSLIGICRHKSNLRKIGQSLGILFFFACVANTVSAGVFTTWYPMETGQSFGYSYILTWVASGICFLSGIYSFAASY